MTRPAEALDVRLYPASACRCLCRLNHPTTGAVCAGLAGDAWSIPFDTCELDGVFMCEPCRDATLLDGSP